MRSPAKFIHRLARIGVIAVLSLVPMSLAVGVKPAAAQVQSISVEFRTALEPYGSFQRVAHWGEVWIPNVAPDWRPYTVGRWVYSDDYGWYWVSDAPEAPWGWIAFHYGRWVWIEDIGWAWVPGREWGPAWVDWRRGGGFVGWAPLPPDDVVEIRDEPQYWVFCRPNDFLVTNIATVFIEPQPILLRETVVVNETVVIHDRGFAVNPGIEPAFIAASIGRPIPQYQVRPPVLAGSASLPNAIEVRAEDLRRTDFQQDLVRHTDIRETKNAIQPAANVPRPQPLGPNEHGRLGQNPPRAASTGQQAPQQHGTLGRAPEQQGGPPEHGAAGPVPEQQQRGPPQPGATGVTPEQQGGPREHGATGTTPEQQRGLPQRGANEPGPGQQRRLYNRGETGLAPGEQRGPRERGPVRPTPEQQRSLRDRGASGPAIEQRRQFGPAPGRPMPSERGAIGSSPGQQRQLFNRAPASPAPGPQRGAGERGPSGPAPTPGGRDQGRGFEQRR